jgi:hypothetical protein
MSDAADAPVFFPPQNGREEEITANSRRSPSSVSASPSPYIAVKASVGAVSISFFTARL